MALVMRGWSRTASTALKLATAERIIGYQFKDVDKFVALTPTRANHTLTEVVSWKLILNATDDTGLAILSGLDWSEIHRQTLSNERLGEVGFKLGLDECAISKEISKAYDMATTLEALIAAVDMDGASKAQVRKVCIRFGLEHKMFGPSERLWTWAQVSSKLRLPDKFFIGHHFRLQESIFETHLKRSPAPEKQDESPWTDAKRLLGRPKRLWRRVRRLWKHATWPWSGPTRQWLPLKEAATDAEKVKSTVNKIPNRMLRRLAARTGAQPLGKVAPPGKILHSAVTRTETNPPVVETKSKAEIQHVKDSVGRQEDNKKDTAPKTTDGKNLAETKPSTSEAPSSSRSTKGQPRPVLADSTSAAGAQPAETGSKGSNDTTKDGAAPTASSVAATSTKKQTEHPADKTSEANSAEGTTTEGTEAQLARSSEEMMEMVKTIDIAIQKYATAKDPGKDTKAIRKLKEQRKQILDKRSVIMSKLKKMSTESSKA
ncbi:hypothetical protein DHEL01_v207238 [Diaporthe helianthi]|uniref:Uncharacterized protein n=1 Tax=Diaporthe helianthi TaxID=158607 RepID=A0A2P5HVT7_DIAHE|nr:hypothetical protein DHEL01_v207238 [Diaporthe helianthi]